MHSVAEDFVPVIAIIFTFGIPGALIFWGIWVKHKERIEAHGYGNDSPGSKRLFQRT